MIKELLFETFKYEPKDFMAFLKRFFGTDVYKLLEWFEMVRSFGIVSLSTFRFML